MPFTLLNYDITQMQVDVIVNAANTSLTKGGGVCGAIFKQAGEQALQEACNRLTPIQTGDAVITPGFNLPAHYIIHTAGPIYGQTDEIEAQRLLSACYTNALQLAIKMQCKSIAFPLISSGIYGYPKDKALKIATTSIQDFLLTHDLDVTLVVYDKESFVLSTPLIQAIHSYIDDYFIDTQQPLQQAIFTKIDFLENLETFENELNFEASIEQLDASFSETLFELIDAKHLDEVSVYKRANIDRKLFSKIRSDNGYMPSKRTACALVIALELSVDEANALLGKAGYTLSGSILFDVILMYFIETQNYNLYDINEVLFFYDQVLLG